MAGSPELAQAVTERLFGACEVGADELHRRHPLGWAPGVAVDKCRGLGAEVQRWGGHLGWEVVAR